MRTLHTPPLLIGAALLVWGWQTGFFLPSLLLALVIEASRVVGLRWDLNERDFRRLWDFTVVLFLATAVYLFTAAGGAGTLAALVTNASPATQSQAMSETAQAMLLLFRWTPMVLYLFVTAQAYSTTEFVPWRVFSPRLRRRATKQESVRIPRKDGLNTANRYLAVCLLASCIPVQPNEWFYPVLGLLIAWALWARRPQRYGLPLWVGLVSLGLVAGFFAQRGFYQVVLWANARSAAWLAQLINRNFDALECHTALGEIGRLKLSGKVVLRLEPKDGQAPPALLREASYQLFKFPDWAGAGKIRDFAPLIPGADATTWELAPQQTPQHAISLAQYLPARTEDAWRGLLALPQGIVRLERLTALIVTTNRLGVVRVDEGPGLVVYDAFYRQGTTLDAPPDADHDLTIPANELPALAQITNQLHLAGKSAPEILRAVSSFFLSQFHYSTWLPSTYRARANVTPLSNFLLRERAGHCEYFATAAVLLLREAGVPARYAVGYSVQEKSGRKYIVRERHAHAWCLAWVDRAWRDFDVTPASWRSVEDARASWTEWLADAWSWLWFEFSRWRWGQAHLRDYLVWIVPPILGALLLRLVLASHWKRRRRQSESRETAALRPGSDSEYYQLEEMLARHGLLRQPNETPLDWLNRLKEDPALASLRETLRELVCLHYRYRFDPVGLAPAERAELKGRAQRCLVQFRNTMGR